MIKIRRGLDVPITGSPRQVIASGPPIRNVAIVADDYIGMKPTMEVEEGQAVKLGQLLFTDKKTEGVRYTAPGAGKVVAVNRGAKRAFQSVVIELEGDAEETFAEYRDTDLPGLSCDQVRDNLVESGLWPVLRTRPFSKVPSPQSSPHSIFVQAIDTNPLAPSVTRVMEHQEPHFINGLQVLKHLTDGSVYLCQQAGETLPGGDLSFITVEEFAGPHPAGLPGTHIHYLDPVSDHKTVWYIGYQDVIAVGQLFATGRLPIERVISLAGPQVEEPELIRTRVGASVRDITEGKLKEGENRIISGSVLSGRQASGPKAFLGRYHVQVSVLLEGREREFLGWHAPGGDKFSIRRVFLSGFASDGRHFPFNTTTNGSRRAMVPIGMYEDVMPLDMIPTFLLRSLIIGDTEQARALGALELDEEDLALCTFVCPGKYQYGPILRKNLTTIEREG